MMEMICGFFAGMCCMHFMYMLYFHFCVIVQMHSVMKESRDWLDGHLKSGESKLLTISSMLSMWSGSQCKK
jgi:hypothetical protein